MSVYGVLIEEGRTRVDASMKWSIFLRKILCLHLFYAKHTRHSRLHCYGQRLWLTNLALMHTASCKSRRQKNHPHCSRTCNFLFLRQFTKLSAKECCRLEPGSNDRKQDHGKHGCGGC